MNRFLLTPLFIITIFISVSGCSKWISPVEDRLEGRWKLITIERLRFLDWDNVSNRYENGSFTFLNDGTAVYEDTLGQMNGTWRLLVINDDYYDNNGNRQNKSRTKFLLDLYDFPGNRVLNLDFEDINFRGKNRFLAEYNSPNYRYRYEFRRN